MTFDEYDQKVMGVSTDPDRVDNEEWREYYVLGLAGEAGEVANEYKRVMSVDDYTLTDERRIAILKELGDTLWYLNALARNIGSSLALVAQLNIDKLRIRRLAGRHD